jgi:hypothetical protein
MGGERGNRKGLKEMRKRIPRRLKIEEIDALTQNEDIPDEDLWVEELQTIQASQHFLDDLQDLKELQKSGQIIIKSSKIMAYLFKKDESTYRLVIMIPF